MHHNQDPNFYSKDYYLRSCAGHENFEFGQESNHEIFNYISSIIGTFQGKKILDVGCGRGELVITAAHRGATFARGIDFSEDAIEICKISKEKSGLQNIEFSKEDALTYDTSEKFDLIFLTDIVEHLYDEQNKVLFHRLKKFLLPDGKIIVHTMPTTEFMDYGQYLKFAFYALRGKKYNFLTYEKEREGTHVNLQNKKKFISYLDGYKAEVWYDFASRSLGRTLIKSILPTRFIVSNLWAVVQLDTKSR